MDFYVSENKVISSNNINNNSVIDNNIDINNSYSMPSTTTTANESFANVGGLTQTTATLTPTTLKNIEESFMEIIPPQPRHHPQEARFMPPLVNISANYASIQISNQNNDFNNNSSNNSNSNTSDLDYGSDYETDDSSSQSRSSMQWNAYCDKNNSSVNNSNQMSNNNSNYNNNRTVKPNGKTRGTSGRKPMRTEKLSPEEEKKRQQRRERNKQAAARCRKRRMDHTNQLLMETDDLEDKKHSLLNEIEALRKNKEELEYILESHKNNCKMNANKVQRIDIKPVVTNGSVISKARPTTLPLSCIYNDQMSDAGIPIQTPSAGLTPFLEAMESGTGLTPLLNAGLTPSLVTPTVSSSGCGLRHKSSPMLDSPTLKKLVPL